VVSAAESVRVREPIPKTPWQRVRGLYKSRRWPVIGVLACTSIALGMYGLGEIAVPVTATKHVLIPIPDQLYYLVGLFRFGSPPADFPLPVAFEIARWLAPFTLILAGLGAISAIFTEQLGQLRVYLWYRNHVVICGAGRVGMRLTSTFRGRNKRVVVIDHNPLVSDVEECRELGVPVIRGDAADPAVLRHAMVERARYLIAVSGDDGTNAQVALVANTGGSRKHPLNCYVNVSDGELSVLLDQAATFESSAEMVQYRFFNIFQESSRALLQERAQILRSKGGKPPSLLVVGGSPIAMNVVIDAAHRWQIENGELDPHLHITLIDVEAERRVEAIQDRRPSLYKTCDLSAQSVDPWDSYANPFVFLQESTDPVPTASILCPLDDAAGLRASMKLRRILPNDVPIFVCTTGRRDTGSLLDLASAGVLRQVHGFPVLDRVCDLWVDLMLGGPTMNEDLARGVHAFYVRHRLDEGRAIDDPSMAPWDALPDELRNSSRMQAADYKAKLEAIGFTYRLAPDGQADTYQFTAGQIDQLARLEHDRWLAERIAAGWTYSDVRDTKNKLTPYLICWDCLDEATRELDREAMRDFPYVLSREGFTIVALDEQPDSSKSKDFSPLSPDWVCPSCKEALRLAHNE
jgi:TrkA-N domain/RyR domain